MGRDIGKLTALQVRRAKTGDKLCDGGGLYLVCHKGGSKSWVFRWGAGGKRSCGLGPLHTIGLNEARERARRCRQLLFDGIDPVRAKKDHALALKLGTAKTATFATSAERYFETHKASWRSSTHARDWRNSLTNYVLPTIGDLPVSTIDTGLVLRVLEPIWTTKRVTAARVRSRLESVLDWAKARGYRDGENPARWRGHLDHLLPARRREPVGHHAALPYRDVPAFVAEIRSREDVAALCLRFLVYTAARLREATEATWDEIDGEVWTIPANRMKSGAEHRVPLSRPALDILPQLPRQGRRYVFPGSRPDRPVVKGQLRRLVKAIAGDKITIHGFRSAFRDWAGECTNFPREIAEAALAHVVGDATERAYRRGDALEKRRALMEAWGRYCTEPPAAASEVVPLRGRSHA